MGSWVDAGPPHPLDRRARVTWEPEVHWGHPGRGTREAAGHRSLCASPAATDDRLCLRHQDGCTSPVQQAGLAIEVKMVPGSPQGLRTSAWPTTSASSPPNPVACTELGEDSHRSSCESPTRLPSCSLFPAEPFLFVEKRRKRVNSLPVLLKPNMSVIDEAVFYNFKGAKRGE